MKFVMNRNRTIVSTSGHAVEFLKGVLTHVPKEMHKDVLAVGAIPEDELEDDTPAPKLEMTDAERKQKIFGAFEAIVEENDRDSFTGNGLPDAGKVSTVAGFTVKAAERTALWEEFRAAKDE